LLELRLIQYSVGCKLNRNPKREFGARHFVTEAYVRKLIGLLLGTAFVCHAQWLSHRDPDTPRTKEGKADLTAPAPRFNGEPDLSGVWEAERSPVSEYTRVLGTDFGTQQVDTEDITKYFINVFWDLKPEEQPLRPEAIAIVKERAKSQGPVAQCLPAGVPMSTLVYSFKLVQAPREIVMLPGVGGPPRQIYMDGRRLPKDPDPAWMGYSVGRWEGDTLVVETSGFDERSYVDGLGHPRSSSMRITERFHRRDFGHMDLEMKFEDPKYYTRSFAVKTALNLLPDTDVLEYVCAENEKDRVHLPSAGR
jgi:hypothetical protein